MVRTGSAARRTTDVKYAIVDKITPDPEAQQPEIEYTPYSTNEVIQIYQFLSTLFPGEIASQIIESAGIWSCTYSEFARRSGSYEFSSDTVLLLSSNRIDGALEQPLRRIIVETTSRDQGWSSYPADHGTHRNSWTWFYLTLERKDTSTGEYTEILRRDLWPNVHASKKWIKHAISLGEEEEIVRMARRGDRIFLWGAARFPGWRMQLEKCCLWLFEATHA